MLSDLIATPTLPSGTVPLTAHTANVLQGPADIEFQKDSTVYWLVKVTNPGVHKLLVSNIISPKPIYMQVDVFEHSKYMSKSYLTTSGGQEAFSLSLTDSTEYLIRLSVGDTSQIPNQSTLINFNVQLN